jgi:hypothetical protein
VLFFIPKCKQQYTIGLKQKGFITLFLVEIFKRINYTLHPQINPIFNQIMTDKIKTLQIIHLAVCAGTAIAYFIIGDLSIEKLQIPAINSSSVIYLAIPVFAFILSTYLFKSQLKQIDPKLKIEEKLPVYQTASIMRWAVLEGAAFLILILKPDFILFGILLIIYLAFLRPTEERINNDLSNI